jgi:trimethylamine monooxygenase
VIIFATGYLHSFPFLEESLKLKTARNSFYPDGLYKGVAWIKNTRLFYLGMQNQHYTLPMFDAQASWVMDVVLGYIILPEKESMITESHSLWSEAENLDSNHEEAGKCSNL